MTTLHPELAGLPAPTIIQEIDYEVRLAAFIEKLTAEMAAVGITYDVEALESDPAKVLLEVATYADTMLRQRINESIRANLLAFAYEADLDHLAAFYDVTRLYSEGDEALRKRVILAIQGRSPGGTAPRYRFVALSADVRVADAAVYTVGRDPTVHVAIFSTDNGGQASPGLLSIVDAALQAPAVRMVNDRIVVAAAIKQIVPITANIWLLPTAAPNLVSTLAAKLQMEWAAASALGFDMTRSWLTAKLMQPGVQKVEILAPTVDVIVPFNQSAAFGAITLNDMGRGF